MTLRAAKITLWIGLIFAVCWASLAGVDKLFYWRDDWVFLWSNKNNPPVLYSEIGGPAWWIKSGLFHPAYARLYGKIPVTSLQFSGVVIKTVNSLIVYLLVHSLVRKRPPAFLAAVLFAAYGGSQETYTWHRITGVAAGFAMLVFVCHNWYLTTGKKWYLLPMLGSAILGLFCYFGRIVGIIPVLILSVGLNWYEKPNKRVFFYGMALLLLFGGLFWITKKSVDEAAGAPTANTILAEIKKTENINVYFSNLGNLLTGPFSNLAEMGGLIGSIAPTSLAVGKIFFGAWLASILIFMLTKSPFLKLISISMGWLFLTYFPNWMYAGGGPGTMIGAAHRYFGITAVFVPIFAGVIFARVSRFWQILTFTVLIVISLNYSKTLLDKERYLRDSDRVAKVYQEIVEMTKTDPQPRLIVIDTELDYLATGWFPYAYGYYKGTPDRQDFVPVFANLDAAIKWVCASPVERSKLGSMYGVPSYQQDRPVLSKNLYAWRFSKQGKFDNLTQSFRESFSRCN